MWSTKLSKAALIVITTVTILVINLSPGLTQTNYNFLPYDLRIENLQLNQDGGISKAPVEIDGRVILRVGKLDSDSAEERASVIRKEMVRAIKDDNFTGVKIEEKDRLPVLYLVFDKPPEPEFRKKIDGASNQEQRYLFTVTREDTIAKKSILETAIDLKEEIAQAIAQAKKERTAAFTRRQGVIALVLLLVALFISRLIEQLQTYPLRKAIQRVIPGFPSNTTSSPSNLTTLFRLKLGFAQFLLWTVTIFAIACLFPLTRHWLYALINILIGTFNTSVFSWNGKDFSIIKLLFLIGLLIGSIVVSGHLANLLRSNVLQATRMSRGSQEIIYIITKYGLVLLASVVLLQAYGLDLSSLTLIGSALGVGIGFGFQDIARNFASGIVLLFERSIQVGDFIQVGDHLGVVEEVRTRSIVLKTLDRVSIIVPNSRVLSEEVINWNHRKSVTRLHLPIGVAYESDVAKVKSALLQAAEEHLEVLRNPSPQVFFTEFADSSLNFELLVWTSDPSRQAPLKSDLYFRIKELFEEQQIDIPFPQRDINLKMGDLPIRLSEQLESHLLYWLRNLISQKHHNDK
ncbi:mechanosensitive ion channel family protein [Pleurocapsa sp. FMAR1]|uniref:mechanosensitive ion channel family protein n=1 Tax=Pleurocapsa sp. FMAR1 TaxID=3040204 RepID=UPI0029C8AFC9|nr:mechanosensitive ion channel domain-containing protein [Pleurocapsa sp. FMAR1]